MKLSVSNIAWSPAQDEAALARLVQLGVRHVELAPTKRWPSWDVSLDDANRWRGELASRGFSVSSLQAVVFGKPNAKVFGTDAEKDELRRHLQLVARIAGALGAGPVVFGAPKNRDRGSRSMASALAEAAEFFRAVAPAFAREGACLCLEPNPIAYACNFVTDSSTGAALVRRVAERGFRLHLDAAGMHLAGENLFDAVTAARDVLAHVHISEPQLGTFGKPEVAHRELARGLREIGWEKVVAIEMREPPRGLLDVEQAINRVKALYEFP